MTDVKAEEPFDPTTVPVKPAATVLLIRDADDGGIEVFMLRRTFSAAFASGMFVFPGGKVDDVDGIEEIAEISYQEAMELSHFGAKIIYPPTIQPVMYQNIPVWITNACNISDSSIRIGAWFYLTFFIAIIKYYLAISF